jgi:hypothetical protein
VSGFPGSPRLLKAGIALIDPASGAVQRVVALQYNPDTLTRTLQPQTVGAEGGERSEALRFKAPPVESFKLDAEIDITDQLEAPDRHPEATQVGLYPQLAALETLAYPSSRQLEHTDELARSGTLDIAPMESPLPLFIWSKSRVVPIRLTDFSITEEAFDPDLNPIRAKVSLGMRVLSVYDLGFDHRGGALFMTYLRSKERFAAGQASQLGELGLTGLP